MSRARLLVLFLVCLALPLILIGCHKKEVAELKALKAQDAVMQANLATFDDLDFNVFSSQKWDQLGKSHAANIVVHWPDGHTTTGIERHIEDLKSLFVYAPDTHVNEHPIKVASGDYTAVTGVFEGTFTQPMPIGDGKFIQPTGKAFKLEMCTVGHWKDGVMDEEYLFWDNKTFMDQVGLGQAPKPSDIDFSNDK